MRRLLCLCALFFHDTYRREPSVEKLAFFRKAIASCGVWFMQMPLTCIIAWSTNKWTRHRVATAWMAAINTLTLAFLLYSFQPARAKSYFTISAMPDELDGLTGGGHGDAGDGDGDGDGRGGRRLPASQQSAAYGRYGEGGGGDESRREVPDQGML